MIIAELAASLLQLDQRLQGHDQQIAATFRRHHQARTIESMLTPPSSHIHTRQVAGVLRQILERAAAVRGQNQMPLTRASRNRSVTNLPDPCRISAGNRHVTKPSCGAWRRTRDHTLMVRWSRRAVNSD